MVKNEYRMKRVDDRVKRFLKRGFGEVSPAMFSIGLEKARVTGALTVEEQRVLEMLFCNKLAYVDLDSKEEITKFLHLYFLVTVIWPDIKAEDIEEFRQSPDIKVLNAFTEQYILTINKAIDHIVEKEDKAETN
jgi:flagellar biosynthesis regulator FlbT